MAIGFEGSSGDRWDEVQMRRQNFGISQEFRAASLTVYEGHSNMDRLRLKGFYNGISLL